MRKVRKPVPRWRRALRAFNKGLMFVLRPLQIVNNFVFLSVAYFVGVGIASLSYRLGPGKKSRALAAASPDSLSTYWRKLPPAPTDRDTWLRPF